MAVNRADLVATRAFLLLACVYATNTFQVAREPSAMELYQSEGHSWSQWAAFSSETAPRLRRSQRVGPWSEVTSEALQRHTRGIKRGSGHVLNAFKKVPGMALDVALEIVTNATDKDCAIRCVHTQCGAWSFNRKNHQCRLGCVRFPNIPQCKYVAVPVAAPDWDFYEISLAQLGAALFTIITSGATLHSSGIRPNQIRTLDDPLAPENIIRPKETHEIEPTSPPSVTEPPTQPSSGGGTVRPPPTVAPPIPTPPPALIKVFDFPIECGTRPTFGLSDNVRLLVPDQTEEVRIVGGAKVAAGTYPWQAEILVPGAGGYKHSCGGILVSENLILTAAHCHNKHEGQYELRVGQHDFFARDPSEAVYSVENLYRHSGYRPDLRRGQRNDIAMFKIKFGKNAPIQRVTFDDYVQPLCMPSVNTTLYVGQQCQISGWGVVTPGSSEASHVLRGAVISILDPAICYKAYGNKFDRNLMVCAGRPEGGVDSCQGDSGGPLSCRDETGQWFAAGVVSFGWGCAKPGHPGVYTRVTAYLEWIHRTARFMNGQF